MTLTDGLAPIATLRLELPLVASEGAAGYDSAHDCARISRLSATAS